MDRIFKWFTLQEEDTQARIVWFAESFEMLRFEGADQLLMEFLRYCAKLGIPGLKKYLEVFLATEGKKVIKAEKIKIDTLEALDYDEPGSLEEACRVLCSAAVNRFGQCMQADLEGHCFKVDIKSFLEEQKASQLVAALAEQYPRVAAGDAIDEIMDTLQYEIDKLSQMDIDKKLDKLDFLSGHTSSDGRGDKKKFLFKTGVPCIDGDIGGMYTKQCWTFTGPPGSGKSRFAYIHMAYQAAVIYKLGVLIDSMELSAGEVENILVAYHLVMLYKGKVKIPDALMNRNDGMDEQQKRFYESARIDLFESGKYGRIVISHESLDVEAMYKKRIQFFRMNRDVRAWVVDYLGILCSKPTQKYAKQLMKYEIIGKGMVIVKEIADEADIGALCLCQYNDEGIKACMAGKPIQFGMVEGGHIIQRHSDYDIAMTMTEEQKLAKMRMLSTIKLRGSEGFSNVPFRTDLAVSVFKQMTTI